MTVDTVERARPPRERLTRLGDDAPLLSIESTAEPTVTLSVTPSPESREAFTLLEAAGIDFRAVPAPDGHALSAEFGGLIFEGVSGVRDLIEALHEFDDMLISGLREKMPHILERADESVASEERARRQRWLDEARSVFDRVSTSAR